MSPLRFHVGADTEKLIADNWVRNIPLIATLGGQESSDKGEMHLEHAILSLDLEHTVSATVSTMILWLKDSGPDRFVQSTVVATLYTALQELPCLKSLRMKVCIAAAKGGNSAGGEEAAQGRSESRTAAHARTAHDALQSLYENFESVRQLSPAKNTDDYLAAVTNAVFGDDASLRGEVPRLIADAARVLVAGTTAGDFDVSVVVKAMNALWDGAQPSALSDSGGAARASSGTASAPAGPGTPSRQSEAPSGTGDREKNAEPLWQLQQARLWCLWCAMMEKCIDKQSLVRALSGGDLADGAKAVRIDCITTRGESPRAITSNMVAWRSAALTELKITLGYSTSDASADGSANPPEPPFTSTAGFSHAVFQSMGRVGQCFQQIFRGGDVTSRQQFVDSTQNMFPVAMGIGDYKAIGVVLVDMHPDWILASDSDRTKLPLRATATAISQLVPKSGNKSGDKDRPIDRLTMPQALQLSILMFLVDEKRQGISVTYKESVQSTLTFDGGGDQSGGDGQPPPRGHDGGAGSEGVAPPRGSEGGAPPPGSKEGAPPGGSLPSSSRTKSKGGNRAGAPHSTPPHNSANAFTVNTTVDDTLKGETVVVCLVTAITAACADTPSWLHAGARVVVKRSITPVELACWRAVDGCEGVPRVFTMREGGRTVALTPDGVGSLTMRDWFGAGKWASKKWAQMIVSRLLAVVRRVHGCGVVHADLHPGNIVLVRDFATGTRLPLVIDFGLARLVETCDSTPLTRLTATMSVRGTALAQSNPSPPTWCPTPTDDLESVALLGEWLVGCLPDGHATPPEVKRDLLANGRARDRWGIDLPHLNDTTAVVEKRRTTAPSRRAFAPLN